MFASEGAQSCVEGIRILSKRRFEERGLIVGYFKHGFRFPYDAWEQSATLTVETLR